VDTLVKKAYDNWMHVIEYDGKSLLNYNQDKNLEPAHPQALMGSHEYSNLIQQTSIHSLPHPVNTGQPSMDTGATVGGMCFLVKHFCINYKSKRVLQLFWIALLSTVLLLFSHHFSLALFNTLSTNKSFIRSSISLKVDRFHPCPNFLVIKTTKVGKWYLEHWHSLLCIQLVFFYVP
jgi:hypothetical protein